MIQYTSSFPQELQEFYTNFETKNVNDQEMKELLEKTLLHSNSITSVDKKLFLKLVKKPAQNNASLQKLAVKILLESGKPNKQEIDQKISLLQDSEQLLDDFEELLDLLEDDSFITPELLEDLTQIPSSQKRDIYPLIEKITSNKEERAHLLSNIAYIDEKERIDLLKHLHHLIHSGEKGDPLKILTAIEAVPRENRTLAVEMSLRLSFAPIDQRLLLFACFSPTSYEKLTQSLSNGAHLTHLVHNDAALKEEFTHTLNQRIAELSLVPLTALSEFLSIYQLWLPGLPEQVIRHDMRLLGEAVKSGLKDEIVSYLRTDEGTDALIENFATIKVNDDLIDLITENFTEAEYKIFSTAQPSYNLEGIENIANPTLFNYLRRVTHFKRPHLKPSQKEREAKAALSVESKKEIEQFLASREGVRGADWKRVVFAEQQIATIRPHIDQLRQDLRCEEKWEGQDRTMLRGRTRVKLFGEEIDSIRLYTTQHYLLINGYLDNDATSINMWCKHTFKKGYKELNADERNELQKALKATEKVLALMASGMNKIPSFKGTVYRGDAIASTELEKWQEGKVFTTSKFFSCSTAVHVGEFFAKSSAVDYMKDKQVEYKPILYAIESQSSKNIVSISKSPQEDERLYLPNQSFQVVEIDETSTPGLTVVFVREIDLNESAAA